MYLLMKDNNQKNYEWNGSNLNKIRNNDFFHYASCSISDSQYLVYVVNCF